MATTLDDLRGLYFMHRNEVRRLTDHEKGQVPDGEDLAKLDKEAGELGYVAGLLHHYLPERADEQLEASKRACSTNAYGNQPARYALVWPDGELKGAPYVQEPAAVKKFEQASRNFTGLRLWDNRLGKFILGGE